MTPKRHIVRRYLRVERWRIIALFRWYHGFGQPQFELEFRFGRPKRIPERDLWLIYEDEDAA